MTESIMEILRQGSERQADRLLHGIGAIHVEGLSKSAMKKRILKSAGARAALRPPRWALLTACALAALVMAMGIIGFDRMASAIGRLFGFVAGYGIVEQAVAYELDEYTLTIRDDRQSQIKINYILAQDDVLRIGTEVASREEHLSFIHIYQNGNLLNYLFSGASETEDAAYQNFSCEIDISGIRPGDLFTMTFIYGQDGVSTAAEGTFTLKPIEITESITDFGDTIEHNQLSLTLQTSANGEGYRIDVYPNNQTGYDTRSLGSYRGLTGERHRVKLVSGAVTLYPEEEAVNGPFLSPARYLFRDIHRLRDARFIVPYVMVTSREKTQAVLPVPEDGHVEEVSIPIRFKDAALTVYEVSREGEELRAGVKVENLKENYRFADVQYVYSKAVIPSRILQNYSDEGVLREILFTTIDTYAQEIPLELSLPVYRLEGEYAFWLK